MISTVALLLLAFRLMAGGADQPLVTTTEANNLLSIRKYINDENPSVVLVGSSLLFRISESYFSSLKVDNLALAGESSITGLAIIEDRPTSPRLVIIETNLIVRPVDKLLVAASRGRATFGRPIRILAQKYEDLIHTPPDKDRAKRDQDQMLSMPAADAVNQTQLARSIAASFADYPSAVVEANLTEMTRMISTLKKRGTRIALLDVPMSPQLESEPLFAKARQRVRLAFRDQNWLEPNVEMSELRWTDGAHFDTRSAIIFARAIEASAKILLTSSGQ
ncbi:hypothetical protein [Bradyrhizobium tropiciagri]|uniref:hypothetical protein n=1 Tax=Bradyrhizobium tropiciagri TaxID=312253 RepID=UPI001009AF5B|nr:hypothetical protein [Bradyrhizobium tropiciagri]